ncbi:MAG: hypothetical protein K2Y28_06150 [Burkholderiaceae bacterium]|nr:hypothetical protein [Burkholderiaceae bacterium]
MTRQLIDQLGVFVARHRNRGILLDTNILLLFISARYQPSMIGNKRLQAYTGEDGDLLIQFVQRFGRILTTQHVLAETNNLTRQIVKGRLHESLSDEMHPLFCLNLPTSFEQCTIDGKNIDRRLFGRLGLTDSALASVVQTNQLLLTADLDLYTAVVSDGGDAINFNHMREAAGLL